MHKSRIDSVTLVVAALAAALSLTQLSGPFAWMSSIGGLIVLLVLFAFDQEGHRTVFQSLAFSAVCGFSAAVASGIVFQVLANHGEVHLANGQWATEYLPLTCAFATAIFWAIDLMRMNARKVGPVRVPRALGDTIGFAQTAQTAQASSYAAPQPANAPATVPEFAPAERPSQNVFQADPVPTVTPTFVPPPAPPLPRQPAPARASSSITSLFSEPSPSTTPATDYTAPAAAPAPAPLHPAPAPVIPRTGKETMIYVSLVGEGLNVLRSVRAEALGRDYYRITDEMPSNETWQFQPGQVVRCKKQNLSSGKAMVAFEEAQRAG
jgi:hypothetical protein